MTQAGTLLAPDHRAAEPGAIRTGARIVGLSLVVTAVVVGSYLVVFGRGGATAHVTTPQPTSAPAPAFASVLIAPATGAPQPSYPAQVRTALAKLPTGHLDATGRRSALIKYVTAVGLDLGPASSPAGAAQSACTLLAKGASAAALVDGIVTGAQAGGVTVNRDRSRAFLLGATTLYCPRYASRFQS